MNKRGMKVHDLKCWPESFQPAWEGMKRAEFRRNDRDYRVNDVLILREFDFGSEEYSGRLIFATATHVLYGPEFEIPDGLCMISFHETYRQTNGSEL